MSSYANGKRSVASDLKAVKLLAVLYEMRVTQRVVLNTNRATTKRTRPLTQATPTPGSFKEKLCSAAETKEGFEFNKPKLYKETCRFFFVHGLKIKRQKYAVWSVQQIKMHVLIFMNIFTFWKSLTKCNSYLRLITLNHNQCWHVSYNRPSFAIKVVFIKWHSEIWVHPLNCCHSAFIKCDVKNVAAYCFVSLLLVLASEWARRVRSISLLRALAAPTFPPVHEHRVHRVYTDTADSCVTPPNSHAPSLHQSALHHVLITRCLRVYWSKFATPLFLIGNMLPPARLFWILFLLFFFLRSWFTQLRLDLAVKSGYTYEPGVYSPPVSRFLFSHTAVYRVLCSACRPLLQTR